MTTFRSYGAVGSRRQGDIIRSLTGSTEPEEEVAAEIVRDVLNKLRRARGPG